MLGCCWFFSLFYFFSSSVMCTSPGVFVIFILFNWIIWTNSRIKCITFFIDSTLCPAWLYPISLALRNNMSFCFALRRKVVYRHKDLWVWHGISNGMKIWIVQVNYTKWNETMESPPQLPTSFSIYHEYSWNTRLRTVIFSLFSTFRRIRCSAAFRIVRRRTFFASLKWMVLFTSMLVIFPEQELSSHSLRVTQIDDVYSVSNQMWILHQSSDWKLVWRGHFVDK